MPGRRNSSGSVSSDVSEQGTAKDHNGDEVGEYEKQRAKEVKAWKEEMARKNRNPPARGHNGSSAA